MGTAMGKILISVLMFAWMALVLVRLGNGAALSTAYGQGVALGTAFVLVVAPLVMIRVWAPGRVRAELREGRLQYGLAGMILAGLLVFAAGQGTDAAAQDRIDDMKAGLRDGCLASGAPQAACDCLAVEIIERGGVDPPEEMRAVEEQMQRAIGMADPAALPPVLADAAGTCASQAA
jgi:hypothetical protein